MANRALILIVLAKKIRGGFRLRRTLIVYSCRRRWLRRRFRLRRTLIVYSCRRRWRRWRWRRRRLRLRRCRVRPESERKQNASQNREGRCPDPTKQVSPICNHQQSFHRIPFVNVGTSILSTRRLGQQKSPRPNLGGKTDILDRAGNGNRTRMASLEGWNFTIKLCPRVCCQSGSDVPVRRGLNCREPGPLPSDISVTAAA